MIQLVTMLAGTSPNLTVAGKASTLLDAGYTISSAKIDDLITVTLTSQYGTVNTGAGDDFQTAFEQAASEAGV